MIDLIYLTHNRAEFTKASLAALLKNTDWSLVKRFWIYVGESRDGTKQVVAEAILGPCVELKIDVHAAIPRPGMTPVEIMNSFLDYPGQDGVVPRAIFAKIDNDVIVPPGWLNAAVAVMEAHPELGMLGLEPPASRTPAPWAMDKPVPRPEERPFEDEALRGYVACDAIGGVGLIRRSAFGAERMKPHSTYGGFTDWQLAHPEVVKGWIVPPLKLFLLDRLPFEPWASLSRDYIAKGWQRPWSNYDPKDADKLWGWWKP